MSDPSRPVSRPATRRTTRGATGPGGRPAPRPPFLILTDTEEIQVESLGSMALRLSHPGPKDGWRIIDDSGREWTAADLQAAVLDPEGRRPSDPNRSLIDDDGARPAGIGRHATLIGLGMVVAGVALLGTCMGGGSQAPRPATPPPVDLVVPERAIPPQAQVPGIDLANGLICHYDFDSVEGISRNRTAEVRYDAMEVVEVTVDHDPVRGQGVAVFSGRGHLQVPVSVRGEFTIAWWMCTSQTDARSDKRPPWYEGIGLVSGEMPGDVADFGCTLIAGRIAFGGGQPDTTWFSKALVNDGAWHHVAVLRDGELATMSIVIDGKMDVQADGPRGPRSASTSLWLGSSSRGSGCYAGRLDDVRFYGRQLTLAEIAALARPTPVR